MEASNAMLHDLGNSHRLGDSLTKGGENDAVLVVGVEFFEDLVDEDSSLNVTVDADNTVGDGLAFGAHLAVLLHFRLISGCSVSSCL